jgi:hypothetical protein
VKNVNHSSPDQFAKPTEQTNLSKEVVEDLKIRFPGPNDLQKIGRIHHWVRKNFSGERGGGKFIAKRSAQQIFESKKLTGCNDWGIMMTALLRVFEYPVIFMNAAGIEWAKRFRAGIRGKRLGHVFLEIYIPEKKAWIVMDSVTTEYLEDYDFNDPVIPIPKKRAGEEAYFVYLKGKDHWSMGIRDPREKMKVMIEFARQYPLETITIKKKTINRLFRGRKRKTPEPKS